MAIPRRLLSPILTLTLMNHARYSPEINPSRSIIVRGQRWAISIS